MVLSIKNRETCRLIRELATITDESLTQAVTVAVRERLEQVNSRRQASLAERLLQIGKTCAGHLKEPFRSIDHGDLLYDEAFPGGLGTEISELFSKTGIESSIWEVRGTRVKPTRFE